jgi:hypothetical protein
MLPLSIYGALAMSHGPDGAEGTAAADEFFIYKFDRCCSAIRRLKATVLHVGTLGNPRPAQSTPYPDFSRSAPQAVIRASGAELR